MRIAVRYYTRSGNTKMLAEAIAEAVGVPAEETTVPLTEKADILFLGCSTYAFDVDDAVKRFIVRNREHIGRIVCFGTSALTGSVRKPMQRIGSALDVYIDGAEFHCRGSFGPLHMGHPNREDLRRAAAFARYVIGE